MNHHISIIIPAYNAAKTIGNCLESIFAAPDEDWEVIVVDDCSGDGSAEVARRYPCRLIRLEKHSGASAARNAGAFHSRGDILFFIDADCLFQKETLPTVRKALARYPEDFVLGGTYTPTPHDPGFFSLFQSVFINASETKKSADPDYVASHAMVIRAAIFKKIGGFRENFLPILEDVELSHRLRRAGYKLVMDPGLQVRHIFNFSFVRSLKNASRKTEYWTVYSLMNRDLFVDSGTASREVKITGLIWLAGVLLALFSALFQEPRYFLPAFFLCAACIGVNRRLLATLRKTGGVLFAILSGLYYMLVYPAAIWTGAFRGIVRHRGAARAMSAGRGT